MSCATPGPILWLASGACNGFSHFVASRDPEYNTSDGLLGRLGSRLFALDETLESVAVFVEPVKALSIEEDYFAMAWLSAFPCSSYVFLSLGT